LTKQLTGGKLDGVKPATPDIDQPIARAADLLREAHYAVALSGAGISTPSGIPDFRSPDSGLWNRTDPFAVASIFAFRRRPEVFYDWIHPLARQIAEARPNPAHLALARLESAGLLRAVITQNIDGLHQAAGSRNVHEVHGHLREATCMRCAKVVPTDSLTADFIAHRRIPHCACGGVLKPNAVLFGELLPAETWGAAERAAARCDLMLVAGSSLEVEPVAGLPLLAADHGARLIIVNYEPTTMDRQADVVIHQDVAQVLPRIAEVLGICAKADLAINTRERV
jgi:NAD-dependent protein deacetylase/lipoamidase